MTEMIDREALKKAIDTWDRFYYVPLQGVQRGCNDDYTALVRIDDILHCIDNMPSADVQPVKHGYWEEVTDYGGWGDTHYRCSVCGEEWYLEDGKPKDNNMNFCPQCGAKMDAEPDEPWQSE